MSRRHRAAAASAPELTRALRKGIDTIVVIYAENRAFDNLYGNFPGARSLREVVDPDGHPLPGYLPQRDRDGSVLPMLPPTWGGVTAPGVQAGGDPGSKASGLPNAPFSIEHALHGAVRGHAHRPRR